MPDEPFALPLAWVGIDDVPIHFANQFLISAQEPGELILSVGQVAPPAVIGTPEQQRQQLQSWPFVPVRPLARFSLNRSRLVELAKLLADVEQRLKEVEK